MRRGVAAMSDVMNPDWELLLESVARPGHENMAIDEQLLHRAVADSVSTLRFYQWDQPTVSLGYFQKDHDSIPERFAGLPVVSRLSGGGAILHDRELTYSLALAKSDPWASDPSRLYSLVHNEIIGAFAELGLKSQLRGDVAADPAMQTFLCFSRVDANDIVVGSQKIVGSAQRRRKGCVLQHGSILMQASRVAPEFPGMSELGVKTTFDDLAGCLAERLAHLASPSNDGDV